MDNRPKPSQRILLVEDNPDDIELTLHSLEENNIANAVDVVRDGRDALDYLFSAQTAEHGWPRLVLLDLQLPRVGGLEVLRAMKENAASRHVPVVVLTSSREEQDLIASYDLGVNGYIIKPVDFDQFHGAVRTLGLFWLVLNEVPEKSFEPSSHERLGDAT